jgi:hypothetical protein
LSGGAARCCWLCFPDVGIDRWIFHSSSALPPKQRLEAQCHTAIEMCCAMRWDRGRIKPHQFRKYASHGNGRRADWDGAAGFPSDREGQDEVDTGVAMSFVFAALEGICRKKRGILTYATFADSEARRPDQRRRCQLVESSTHSTEILDFAIFCSELTTSLGEAHVREQPTFCVS